MGRWVDLKKKGDVKSDSWGEPGEVLKKESAGEEGKGGFDPEKLSKRDSSKISFIRETQARSGEKHNKEGRREKKSAGRTTVSRVGGSKKKGQNVKHRRSIHHATKSALFERSSMKRGETGGFEGLLSEIQGIGGAADVRGRT